MAEYSSVENASEEVFDFVCGPCKLDGEVLQAKGYCSNCKDYLCDLCFKIHLRPKPLRHHVLLDEKAMPKDKTVASDKKATDICTERCEKHSGNIIEYYCQSHDFLGCTKCFISDNHRKCEDVVCIEDAASDIYEGEEYKKLEVATEQVETDLSNRSSMQIENAEKLNMCSTLARRDIKTFRANMNEYMDKLEHEMYTQDHQMKESKMWKLRGTYEHVEKFKNDINQIKGTIANSKSVGHRCNSYISMKRNLQQLKILEQRMLLIKKDGELSEYVFLPDASLQNLTTLGTLGIKGKARLEGFGVQQQSGTTLKFIPLSGKEIVAFDGIIKKIRTKHQCISAMKEYETKSLEELRAEDYTAHRKGNHTRPANPEFGLDKLNIQA